MVGNNQRKKLSTATMKTMFRCGAAAFLLVGGCSSSLKNDPNRPQPDPYVPPVPEPVTSNEIPVDPTPIQVVVPEVAKAGPCKTPRPEVSRRGGGLVVASPPARPTANDTTGKRFRTHVRGSLSMPAMREWVGGEVPGFVVLSAGNRELFLLDEAKDGLFALYREPYGGTSCQLGQMRNCSFGVVLYACDGSTKFKMILDPLLSRTDHLEIQDIRYIDGIVYFNEACQTFSKEAGGKCSSLVALDPNKSSVLWRTDPLVSNGLITDAGRYLIVSYGFDKEKSFVSLVQKSNGQVAAKLALPSSPTTSSIFDGAKLTMPLNDGSVIDVMLSGLDTEKPTMKKGKVTPPPKKEPERMPTPQRIPSRPPQRPIDI
ncbi:MAG: hypothetical protein U0165_06805 [Polyangiaceae bacterium]